MSTTFYKSIIEDEIKTFNIKEESLKTAAKSVAGAYSKNSLTRGQTFLDYNVPSNRCAYIYKYAFIHTGLVTKYFNKLIRKKEARSVLKKKKTLKICCLGGGPGNDIVGLFKVLALSPSFHKKVVEVTILDICGGWRNSFKRIITNLIGGKVKGVSDTFINASNFKFELIQIDLLQNLPANIVTILSEADIVCMVKFVSAILGSSTSVSALQVIGDKLKVGAIVLFIDNLSGKVFKPFYDVSQHIHLKLIYGPMHNNFNCEKDYCKGHTTSKEKKMFGCRPLANTAVTVLGFIKIDETSTSISINTSSDSLIAVLDDDDWDTDDDSENIVKELSKNPLKYTSKSCQHKFTQTDKKEFGDFNMQGNACSPTVSSNVLYSLVDSLTGLFSVLTQLKQQIAARNHCHHCH